MNISPADIYAARRRIGSIVTHTPLIPSAYLSVVAGQEFLLKLETAQPIGAFKLRGAANALLRLPSDVHGVTCCSTGNHGRCVAYAARQRNLRAVICMSSLVPRTKIEAIRALGAEVRIVGNSQDEALAAGDVVMPPVLCMAIPGANGEVDVKTAYIAGFSRFAVKVSPGFFDNPKLDLPSLNGLMVLLSARTGLVKALFLDNGYLTDITAASTARARDSDLTICDLTGTGAQDTAIATHAFSLCRARGIGLTLAM